MRKFLIVAVLTAITLATMGCSDTVNQEEYNKLVDEFNELKDEVQDSEKTEEGFESILNEGEEFSEPSSGNEASTADVYENTDISDDGQYSDIGSPVVIEDIIIYNDDRDLEKLIVNKDWIFSGTIYNDMSIQKAESNIVLNFYSDGTFTQTEDGIQHILDNWYISNGQLVENGGAHDIFIEYEKNSKFYKLYIGLLDGSGYMICKYSQP